MPQALLLLVMSYIALLPAGLSGESPPPTPASAPNSLIARCGEVHIPYPFGIGPECALPGFDVTCKETNPPSLYTGNVRIDDITLETAQMVVYSYFSSTCNNAANETSQHQMAFNGTGTPFLISMEDNMFAAIGCRAAARLNGRNNATYLTGCISYCASLNETGDDGTPCRGRGCCEASITAGLTEVSVRWNEFQNPAYNPCQYAFVAQKVCPCESGIDDYFGLYEMRNRTHSTISTARDYSHIPPS